MAARSLLPPLPNVVSVEDTIKADADAKAEQQTVTDGQMSNGSK